VNLLSSQKRSKALSYGKGRALWKHGDVVSFLHQQGHIRAPCVSFQQSRALAGESHPRENTGNEEVPKKKIIHIT